MFLWVIISGLNMLNITFSVYIWSLTWIWSSFHTLCSLLCLKIKLLSELFLLNCLNDILLSFLWNIHFRCAPNYSSLLAYENLHFMTNLFLLNIYYFSPPNKYFYKKLLIHKIFSGTCGLKYILTYAKNQRLEVFCMVLGKKRLTNLFSFLAPKNILPQNDGNSEHYYVFIFFFSVQWF